MRALGCVTRRGGSCDGGKVPLILDDAALEAAAVTWSHPEDSFGGLEVPRYHPLQCAFIGTQIEHIKT